MVQLRLTYWSNTKLADKVRGTPKLKFGTMEEWRDWRKLARTSHPIRYWIVEEAFTALQNIWMWVPDRINEVRYYLNNRFLIKAHALTASPKDITPGKWCDLSNRFLPCMFNELVNFVEVEKAWMLVAWDDDAREKFKTPWWRGKWWARWFVEWRCPEAGIEHLKWEMSLTDMPSQAAAAKEVYELYTWWTTVYRNRPDPFDESGLTDWYAERRDESDEDDLFGIGSALTPEQRQHKSEISDECHAIEEAYFNEDTEMMKRLIAIRGALWT